MNLKKLKIGLLAIMLLLGLSLIFVILTTGNKPDQENENDKNKTRYRYAKSSQSINDFRYDGHAGSKHLISINCRNLTIRRKKIGFIRFALMKEAILKDTVIKFYTHTDTNKTLDAGNDTVRLEDADIQKALEMITSKDSKLLSNFKNISSIIIQPVIIEFYTNRQLATSISAFSATINLSRQTIIFRKNVIVISGKYKLMLDRLELNPENRLLTGTDYALYSPHGKTAGKTITTDFSLQKVYE